MCPQTARLEQHLSDPQHYIAALMAMLKRQ